MSGHRARRILLVGIREFDDIRISDGHLGVHDGAVRTRDADVFCGFESRNKEIKKLGSAVYKEIRRNIAETWTAEMSGSGRKLCAGCGFSHGRSPLQIGLQS